MTQTNEKNTILNSKEENDIDQQLMNDDELKVKDFQKINDQRDEKLENQNSTQYSNDDSANKTEIINQKNNSGNEENTDNMEDSNQDLNQTDNSNIYDENQIPEENKIDHLNSDQFQGKKVNSPKNDSEIIKFSTEEKVNYDEDLAAFLHFGTLPSLYERPYLLQYLEEKSFNAAVEHNFEEAKKFDSIHNKLYKACLKIEVQHQIGDVTQILNQKINRANQHLSKVKKKWNFQINQARKTEDEKLKLIKSKHKKEMKELDKKWENEKSIRPFSAPSSNLQETLYLEKMAILGGEYELAKQQRKYANKLMNEETKSAQAAANAKAVRDRDILLSKHQAEISAFRLNSQKRLNFLQKQREKEEELAKLHVKKALTKKEHGCHQRQSDAEILCQMRNQDMDPMITFHSPQSQFQKEQFKKTDDFSRLQIKPIRKEVIGSRQTMRALVVSPQTGSY